MRFNATLNVDFSKWTQVKMERENNMKEYKGKLEKEILFYIFSDRFLDDGSFLPSLPRLHFLNL